MTSQTLPVYSKWLENANAKDIEFVDQVYTLAESLYEKGGDQIVECYGPTDILSSFETLQDVRESIGLARECRLNARWGEDSDPELQLI